MPVPHDRAGADDSDPQFMIVRPAHLVIGEGKRRELIFDSRAR
jgi:hypothetical protein